MMTGRSEQAHPTPRWRGTLAALAVVVLAVGLAQTSAGHSLLRKAGLFERPASYTTLAFQHPQSLPQLASAQTDVPVSFVISNVGRTPRTYQWTLSVAQGSQDRRVATGSIRLAPGHRTALTRAAHVVCAQPRVSLVVSLVQPAESIHAWAACPARTR